VSEILTTRAPEPVAYHDPRAENPCPPLTAAERDELKRSLSEGYLAGWPVVRSAGPFAEGAIIDGFHRTELCEELGIEPVVQLIPVESETRLRIYRIRANLTRRNMTTGQRGILAVELKSLYEAEAKEAQRLAGQEYGRGMGKVPPPAEEAEDTKSLARESLARAAKDAGLGRTAAYQAQALVEAAEDSDEAAELLAAVKSGDLALKTAYKRIHPQQEDIDRSIKSEAQAAREIEETVALMTPAERAETDDTARQRALGNVVRIVTELDQVLRGLTDQDLLDYRFRPHTFTGTARRVADWLDLAATALELNR